jgi:D-3-phosphoglycerate dehydrogenase
MKKLENEFEITYINRTDSHLSEEDLIRSIRNADYVLAGTEVFTQKVIESSTVLKGISRVGAGTDNIDMHAAGKRNLQIMNTPDAPILAVSEHTLALLLSILKKIPQYDMQMKSGSYTIKPGFLLSGKTVGVIGLGRIGFAVASMLSALGCRIGFYDPYSRAEARKEWVSYPSLQKLAEASDIITIHAAPQENKAALLDNRFFSSCKKGVILINTARGSLVDEAALEKALADGRVSAAGLDVFTSEPYSGPLLKYPQVLVTPHVASNTKESRQQMEMEAVDNLIEAKRRLKE